MNFYEQIEYSAALIKKRNILYQELQQMKPAVDYLSTPVLYKGQYFLTHRSAGLTAMRVVSNILAAGAGTWLIVLLILVSTDERINHPDLFMEVLGSKMVIISAVIIVAMFLIAAVLGTTVSVMRSKAYKAYIKEDQQYRATGNSMVNTYNQKMNELNQLEITMKNPTICIIPFAYWDKGEAIAACIKSGQAQTLEEAIMKVSVV